MIAILFSILCSTGILIIFKLLPRLQANTSHTILVSYAVSGSAGMLILPVSFDHVLSFWTFVAALEGLAFYGVFHLMARSATTSGIAFTSIASKMSVVIPIAIGLLFLGETGNAFLYTGVALGLGAVVLSVGDKLETSDWRWPVLVFVGAGLIDASFKLFQVGGLQESWFPTFITSIFTFAFITGLLRHLSTGRARISINNFGTGIALGLLNLGTVYFLMQALATKSLDSTVVYSLNSFGIVLMSILVAAGLFRETISTKGYAGIAMAVASIVFLYLAKS